MRKMTETEKELANLLVDSKDFSKEEFIALGLLCNSEEKASEMITYLKDRPQADFEELFNKAVKMNTK